MTTLPKDILDEIELLREMQAGYGCFQPAVDFERRFGLTEIAGRYTMPEGVTASDLQAYALLFKSRDPVAALDGLIRVTEVLKELNPELHVLRYNQENVMSVFHIVMGVASAFNTDDMQHFLDSTGYAALKMQSSPEYGSLCRAFNKAATNQPLNMQWVASPSTLTEMRRQFKAKIKNNPAAKGP